MSASSLAQARRDGPALLDEHGAAGAAAGRIPAGIDLGGRTPPGVALSILAEIVQANPSGAAAQERAEPAPDRTASTLNTAVDPVCGMQVNVATARHTADVDGTLYYFCCANCRTKFLQDPEPYRART